MAHLSPEELSELLADAAQAVEVGARYVHFKDPTRQYAVTGLGVAEADESVAVIYQALYGERITFVRPLASFTASVELDGTAVPRFTKVS